MMRETIYEWDVETVRSDTRDVHDHDHNDTLNEALATARIMEPPAGHEYQLVLVRDVWDADTESLVDRSWAYYDPAARSLPLRFASGSGAEGKLVPKRFHRELARAASNADQFQVLETFK